VHLRSSADGVWCQAQSGQAQWRTPLALAHRRKIVFGPPVNNAEKHKCLGRNLICCGVLIGLVYSVVCGLVRSADVSACVLLNSPATTATNTMMASGVHITTWSPTRTDNHYTCVILSPRRLEAVVRHHVFRSVAGAVAHRSYYRKMHQIMYTVAGWWALPVVAAGSAMNILLYHQSKC